MHAILSKVFGRKKAEDKDARKAKRSSASGSLLEGKFEAVPPITSPSAAHFPENQPQTSPKGKDTSAGFVLFRPNSRPASSPLSPVQKRPADVPHLSLNLPVPKEQRSRALGVVFEADPDALALLDESVIGERRLSPLETLVLVRACSQVIVERGLESLGIMHPHWYSASPDVQRKLISLYIHSLAPNSPPTTLSPSSAAPDSAFQSELAYVRSPHDVAAVLRWGLRHLQLDGDAFGKGTAESAEWAWYTAFAGAERAAGFPPDAFSQTLVPELPPAHGELLFATLEIISSLAAHGEATGSSGSKLSKLLGLWLLTARRSAENDDWNAFYDRWERAGRILEHLFLSRIRDEAVDQRVPRRLTELVDRYPYNQGSTTTDDGLLTRPRFSTRSYEAIFIHLESEYTCASKPRAHPLRIIAEALRSVSSPEDSDLTPVWDDIKKASLSSEGADSFPVFSNVFADETIRLLSLIPADTPDKNVSPTFALLTPTTRATPSRRRSFSLPDTPLISSQNGSSNGHASPSSQGHANVAKTPTITTGTGTAPTTASPETPTDWAQFSNLGFTATPGPRDLASTLWDTDVEVTSPPDVPLPLSRKSSRKRRSVDAHSRRSSVDNPATPTPPAPPPPPTSKVVALQHIRIDEAFVDFWSDALLDPIAASWGKFVLCQLKPLPALQAEAPTWLVIEQTFTRPAPPPPPPAPPAAEAEAEPAVRPRATSPRPSVKSEGSRISSTFSLPKRFSFFSHSQSEREREKGAGKKKAGKMPRVGEMGEIVTEEERGMSKTPEPESKGLEERGRSSVEGKKEAVVEGAEVAVGAAAVVAAGAGVAAVVTEPLKEEAEAETTAALPPSAILDAPTAEETSVPAVPSEEAKPTNGAAQGDEPVPVVPADTNGDVLPAAPGSVVLAGETPGPQVALQTIEPAAVAQAAADEALPVVVKEAPTTQESPAEAVKAPETVDAEKKAEVSAVPVVEEVAAPVVEEAHTSQETITAEAPAQDFARPPVAEPAVEESAPAEPPVVDQPTLVAEETITVVGPTPAPSVHVAPSVIEEPVQEAEPLVKVPTVVVESQPVEEAAPVIDDEPAPAVIVEEALTPDEQPPLEESAPAVVEELLAAEPSAVPEPVAEEPPAVTAVAGTPAAMPVEEPVAVHEPTLAVEESSTVKEPSAEEPVTPAIEEPAHVVAISEEPAAVEPPAPAEEPAQVVNVVREEEQPASEPEEQTSVAESIAQKAPAVEEPTPASEPAVEILAVEEPMPAPESVIEEAPAAEEPTPAAVEPVVEAPAEQEPTPAAPGSVVAESPAVDEPTPGPVGNVEEAVLAAAEPAPANDTPEPAPAVEQSAPEGSAAEPVPEATPAETNGHAETKEVENDVAAPDAPPSVEEPAAETVALPIPHVEGVEASAVAEPAASAPAGIQASATTAKPELSKDESNAVPSEKPTTESEA